MGILATIEAASSAVSNVASLAKQRDAEHNAAPETKALVAARLQALKDSIDAAIAANDLAAERQYDAA